MHEIKEFVCLCFAYCQTVLKWNVNMTRKRDELVMQIIGNQNSLRT